MARDDEDQADKVLKAKTTVIFKFSHIHEVNVGGGIGGGGGFGSSIGVGDLIGGSGVVVDVSGSTVTVEFPGGVPEGPIDLPGSETTVVEEHSSTEGKVSIVIAPWSAGETVTPSGGMFGLPDEGIVLADGLHKSFRLPRPGSITNTVRLPQEFGHLILNPTNTGNCPCPVFLGSMSSDGRILGLPVILDPGMSIPVYEAEPGAAFIVAASSGGCTFRIASASLRSP